MFSFLYSSQVFPTSGSAHFVVSLEKKIGFKGTIITRDKIRQNPNSHNITGQNKLDRNGEKPKKRHKEERHRGPPGCTLKNSMEPKN